LLYYEGYLFIIGGYGVRSDGTVGALSSIEILDTVSQNISYGPSLLKPRVNMQTSFYLFRQQNCFTFIGGLTGEGNYDNLTADNSIENLCFGVDVHCNLNTIESSNDTIYDTCSADGWMLNNQCGYHNVLSNINFELLSPNVTECFRGPFNSKIQTLSNQYCVNNSLNYSYAILNVIYWRLCNWNNNDYGYIAINDNIVHQINPINISEWSTYANYSQSFIAKLYNVRRCISHHENSLFYQNIKIPINITSWTNFRFNLTLAGILSNNSNYQYSKWWGFSNLFFTFSNSLP
jgi:hypothetical protein